MSDVFISYATADREHAKRLAKALEQRGWTVWWDRTILPGSDWQAVIEHALDGSTCAVVLWSRNSVNSSWVRAEAEEARQRNVLIPASLDDARIPLVFRQLQTASLVGWNGKSSHPGLAMLVQGISAMLEKSGSAANSGSDRLAENLPPSAMAPIPRVAWLVTSSQRIAAGLRSRSLRRRLVIGSGVLALSFLGLGNRAALSRVWESAKSHPLRLEPVSKVRLAAIPEDVSFSPDSRLLATVESGKTCVWQPESGKQVRCWTTITDPLRAPFHTEWLAPQLILTSGLYGGEVFDISRTDSSPALADVGSFFPSLSPDKALFAFEDLSWDMPDKGGGLLPELWFRKSEPQFNKPVHTVTIWDVAKRAATCTLKAGSSDYSVTLSWSPDSRFLAVDSEEAEGKKNEVLTAPTTRTTGIWDAHSCKLLNSASFSTLRSDCTEVDWKAMRPGKPCRSLTVSSDGNYYWEYGSTEIHKASDNSAAAHFEGKFLHWGPRPLEFSILYPPNLIRLASPVEVAPLGELTLPFGINPQFVAVSPDGKMFGIPVYDSEGTIYVWNAESNKVTAKLSGHMVPVRFERNGSLLVTSDQGRGEPFGLFETASGRQLERIQKSPAFSPDAQYVAGIPVNAPRQSATASENSVVSVGRIRRRWW
jgi:WD40 repeat protein